MSNRSHSTNDAREFVVGFTLDCSLFFFLFTYRCGTCARIYFLRFARVRDAGRNGRLVVYGPFKKDGAFTTESNESFDTSLRQRDASWGCVPVPAQCY